MRKFTVCLFTFFTFSCCLYPADWEKVAYNIKAITLNDVCVLNGSSAIAAGELGVIKITADAGLTWQAQQLQCHCDLNGITKKTDGTLFTVGTKGTVFKSSNGGKSWSKLLIECLNDEPNLFDIAFYDNKFGLIVGEHGMILWTDDGGASWSQAGNKDKVNLKCVVFVNNNTCISVGDQGSVLVSTNYGKDWSPKASGTRANLKSIRSTDENHIYAVGDSLTFLYSNDVGTTWHTGRLNTSNKAFRNPGIRGFVFTDSLNGFVRVDDLSSDYPIQSEMKTSDGGKTWGYKSLNSVPIFNKASKPKAFEMFDKDFGMSVGYDGETAAIMCRFNELYFFNVNFNLATNFEKIAAIGNSHLLALYNHGSLFEAIISDDAGFTWSIIPNIDTIGKQRGLPDFKNFAYTGPNTIFMAINNTKDSSWISGGITSYTTKYYGFIIKTYDKGKSWKEFVFPSMAECKDIIMHDSLYGIAQLAKKYFYRTYDGWESYDSVFVPDTSYKISRILSPAKGEFIISVYKKDWIEKFYYTKNDCLSWDTLKIYPMIDFQYSFGPGKNFVAYGRSTDSQNGKYFNRIYTSEFPFESWALQVDEETTKRRGILSYFYQNNRQIAFIGRSYPWELEYYISPELGSSWKSDSTSGMELYEGIRSLAFLGDGTMFGVGNTGTMLKYKEPETSNIEEYPHNPISRIVVLPNPAGDYIVIDGISNGEIFAIYSSYGSRIIESVYSGFMDISSLPPGVYFIVAGNKTGRFAVIE